MPILPQLKSVDLIDRLNSISAHDRKNEVFMRKLKAEAEGLVRADPLGGYMVLGMISCLQENVAAMRDYHKKALRLAPKDRSANVNFAASLDRCGYISEEIGYLLEVYAATPKDPDIIIKLIFPNINLGRYNDSLEFIIIYNKLRPDNPCPRLKDVKSSSNLIKECGVEEKDVEKYIGFCIDFLHENNVFSLDFAFRFLSDEFYSWIDYSIIVDRPVDQVINLSAILAERLASEKFSSNLMDCVTIGLEPLD